MERVEEKVEKIRTKLAVAETAPTEAIEWEIFTLLVHLKRVISEPLFKHLLQRFELVRRERRRPT